MKQSRMIASAVVLAVWAVAASYAASTNPAEFDAGQVSKRITKYCDPVCELRAQDAAFSLLIEAYRQFQGRQIQRDYETRLKGAARLGHERDSFVIGAALDSVQTYRAWVEALADKERELRLEQLETRVVNFTTAYGCARRNDPATFTQPIPSQVDMKAAAERLKRFQLLALGSPANANYRTVKLRPAADVFLDSEPVGVWQEQLIEPCEDEPATKPDPTR